MQRRWAGSTTSKLHDGRIHVLACFGPHGVRVRVRSLEAVSVNWTDWLTLVAAPSLFGTVFYFLQKHVDDVKDKFNRLEDRIEKSNDRIDTAISEVNHKVTIALDDQLQLRLAKDFEAYKGTMRHVWDKISNLETRSNSIDELVMRQAGSLSTVAKILEQNKKSIETMKKVLDIR